MDVQSQIFHFRLVTVLQSVVEISLITTEAATGDVL